MKLYKKTIPLKFPNNAQILFITVYISPEENKYFINKKIDFLGFKFEYQKVKNNSSKKHLTDRNKFISDIFQNYPNEIIQNQDFVLSINPKSQIIFSKEFNSFSSFVGFLYGNNVNTLGSTLIILNEDLTETNINFCTYFTRVIQKENYIYENELNNYQIINDSDSNINFCQKYKTITHKTITKGKQDSNSKGVMKEKNKHNHISQIEKLNQKYNLKLDPSICFFSQFLQISNFYKNIKYSHILAESLCDNKKDKNHEKNILMIHSDFDYLIDRHIITFDFDTKDKKVFIYAHHLEINNPFIEKLKNFNINNHNSILYDYLTFCSNISYWDIRNSEIGRISGNIQKGLNLKEAISKNIYKLVI